VQPSMFNCSYIVSKPGAQILSILNCSISERRPSRNCHSIKISFHHPNRFFLQGDCNVAVPIEGSWISNVPVSSKAISVLQKKTSQAGSVGELPRVPSDQPSSLSRNRHLRELRYIRSLRTATSRESVHRDPPSTISSCITP